MESNDDEKTIYNTSILLRESIANTQSVTDSRMLEVDDLPDWNPC